MTPDAAAEAIEAALEGTLAGPIAWPNIPFTPPAAGRWDKVDIIWGDGFMLVKDANTLGVDRVVGVLQLMGFERKDASDSDLRARAEGYRAFSHARLSGGALFFAAASGPRMGFEESWRTVTVSIPFLFTDTRII